MPSIPSPKCRNNNVGLLSADEQPVYWAQLSRPGNSSVYPATVNLTTLSVPGLAYSLDQMYLFQHSLVPSVSFVVSLNALICSAVYNLYTPLSADICCAVHMGSSKSFRSNPVRSQRNMGVVDGSYFTTCLHMQWCIL